MTSLNRYISIVEMTSLNRYISIVKWARQRYTSAGVLIISTGGKPSTYSRIESAAFEKYMRYSRDESGAIVVN